MYNIALCDDNENFLEIMEKCVIIYAQFIKMSLYT